MEGIASGFLKSFGFGAVHGEQGSFPIAAEGEASPAGGPTSQRRADNRFVSGGARNGFKCQAGIERDGYGSDQFATELIAAHWQEISNLDFFVVWPEA